MGYGFLGAISGFRNHPRQALSPGPAAFRAIADFKPGGAWTGKRKAGGYVDFRGSLDPWRLHGHD